VRLPAPIPLPQKTPLLSPLAAKVAKHEQKILPKSNAPQQLKRPLKPAGNNNSAKTCASWIPHVMVLLDGVDVYFAKSQ